jgi:phosphate uptake regulator
LTDEDEELQKEIKELKKKSRDLYEAAERQLTVAISAYVAPRKSQTCNENNKKE